VPDHRQGQHPPALPVRHHTSLRVPYSMNASTYNRLSSTVSTTRKSQAMIA
jgi:hypothetical protein